MQTDLNVLQALLEERPAFHGGRAPGTRSWPLDDRVLHWMADHVPAGGRSLETGCGYSTVVLGALSERHVAISPFAEEHGAIGKWLEGHGISSHTIEFVAGSSEAELPEMALSALDFVLIDGNHAFPAPFIDWFYTADALRPGGVVIIDDLQLKPCRMLYDFLRSERDRWALQIRIGRASVFRRVTEAPVAVGLGWWEQPGAGPSRRHPIGQQLLQHWNQARRRVRKLGRLLGRVLTKTSGRRSARRRR